MYVQRNRNLLAGLLALAFCGAALAQQTDVVKPAQPAPPPASQPAPAPTTQPTGGTPKLDLTPTEMDIGDVWQGMPVKHEFTVKNSGEAPLTLELTSSCGCTVPTKPKTPLAPGETSTFTITYDSKSIGPVSKNVTVKTNSPTQLTVPIIVRGKVKPIYAVKPMDKIIFQNLEMSTKSEQILTLENQYGQPLDLKLKDGQDYGKFDVTLKTLEEMQKYELRVATKPPLNVGQNRAMITLELPDKLPAIVLNAFANAQPRVFAMPLKLLAVPGQDVTTETVRVQYKLATPVKITEIKCNLEGVKWEQLPDPAPVANSEVGHHEFKVTLPKFDDVPEQGAALEILTDDPAPEYAKLEIPIGRRAGKPAVSTPVRIDKLPQPTPIPAPTPTPTPAPAPKPEEKKP